MGSSRGWHKGQNGSPPVFNWQAVRSIEGIKVLKHVDKINASLPTFSNTPYTKYLRQAPSGGIDQLRIFIGRHSFYDIDWGHDHGEFKKGTAHVQKWVYDSKTGNVTRIKGTPDKLSPYMIKKYGHILIKADPNIKF